MFHGLLEAVSGRFRESTTTQPHDDGEMTGEAFIHGNRRRLPDTFADK